VIARLTLLVGFSLGIPVGGWLAAESLPRLREPRAPVFGYGVVGADGFCSYIAITSEVEALEEWVEEQNQGLPLDARYRTVRLRWEEL